MNLYLHGLEANIYFGDLIYGVESRNHSVKKLSCTSTYGEANRQKDQMGS